MLTPALQIPLLLQVWTLPRARVQKRRTSVGSPTRGKYWIAATYHILPIHEARLFSIETQTITPWTTPGNSKVGTEQQRPPVYETIDGSDQRVRRIKVHLHEGSQIVETVCRWRYTIPRSQALTRFSSQVAMTWKQLTHRNVVPLLDVIIDPSQLVLDWTLDEDLMEHITSHPKADRLGLVGIPPVIFDDKLTSSPAI